MIINGEKIKILREKAGLTQKQLSEKTNCPQSNISKWEKMDSLETNFIRDVIKVLAPSMKMFEFFAEDGELDNYLPYWISKEDSEMLRVLNTEIPERHRLLIKEMWAHILKTCIEVSNKQ